MRRFLLLAHKVPVSGSFTLNDLAGGAGRMDEVARVVSTAFTLSNDLRRDTELSVLFLADGPSAAREITIEGRRVRYLNPDERSTAALLKNALVRSVTHPEPVESSPGLVVRAVDPAETLSRFARVPETFWLEENGVPIQTHPMSPADFGVVLSDPYDPTEEERKLLIESGVPRVSVGPRTLRSSQCVDVVHNEADRRGTGTQLPPAV